MDKLSISDMRELENRENGWVYEGSFVKVVT